MHRTVFFLLLAVVFLGLSWEREEVTTGGPDTEIWERGSKPRPIQTRRTKPRPIQTRRTRRPERGHTCICPVGQHWDNKKRKCVRYKTVITGMRGSNGQVSCPPGYKPIDGTCKRILKLYPSCPPREVFDRKKKACAMWLIEHIAKETTTASPKNKK